MEKKWEDVVKDPEEMKVFEALQNPEWDFRTIHGISSEVTLPPDVVKAILDHYSGLGLVRESPIPGNNGERLFTLASRGKLLKESLNLVRASVTKSLK